MERNNTYLALIKRLDNMLEKKLNNVMRELDITTTQAAALAAVLRIPEGQISLKNLEKTMGLSQSVTAGIVSRLEQKKLLEGFGDPSDKRIKLVRITVQGQELCLTAQKMMEQTEADGLAGLTETEKEIFGSLLKKAIATMR